MIHHVGLELDPAHADAEVAFWGLLGFVEVAPPGPDPVGGSRTRWVERDGFQLHLLLVDAPVVPRSGHVAVTAPEWDATIATLRAAGHEAAERTRYWGAARTQIVSPGGHRVELMAAPPAPTPSAG